MKTDFYKNISAEKLAEYAENAGLGGDIPKDFEAIRKFLVGRNRILEVGCGAGRLGVLLIKEFDYVGIDIYQHYLDDFFKKLASEGIDANNKIFKKNFLDFDQGGFDAILFPWTIIGDFDEKEQSQVLLRALEMLNDGGIIVLDNPSPGTAYNTEEGYNPTKFYYDEWENKFSDLGFSRWEKHEYETFNGKRREASILYK